MRAIASLLLVCLVASGQSASTQSHTVAGTVVDPAGGAIPGVAVELRKDDVVERRTVSDVSGGWKFENIAAGSYAIRFALPGFVTTDVRVSVGAAAPAPLKVVLKVGAVSEVVEVTGATQTMDRVQRRASHFIKDGINRVILATDGDFNVGMTSRPDLVRLIEEKRERGIFLSVLGVGDNNLKDSTMEMLADKGNGNYSYLDSIQEGRRVLIAEAGATLVTVAKDVKIQIEFNPRFVGSYRLIGYENRLLRKEDFNDDRKDAGEIGAGHSVTALYELIPPGEPSPGGVDPLKYQSEPKRPVVLTESTELMTVKVRYKAPDGDASKLLEVPVRSAAPRMSANLGFAAAVAEFGMLLRRSEFRGSATWSQAAALAREHRGRDDDGYRAELTRLVELAAALDTRHTSPESDARR